VPEVYVTGQTVVVVKDVKTSVDLLGYGVVLYPVPVREVVGFQEDELMIELDVGFVDEDEEVYDDELMDDFVEELEEEEEEPVAQEDFPTHASLGMAAAEPTRAATKSDRDECILKVWVDRVSDWSSMMYEMSNERLSIGRKRKTGEI
jgi:hypothetical protein